MGNMPKRRYLEEELGVNNLNVCKMVHSRRAIVNNVIVNRESEPYVRFFSNAHNVDMIMGLSGGSVKLLWYAMANICYGDNYVIINVKRFMKKADVRSMTSYRSYVRELIDAKVFAKTNIDDVFYFDHNLFFKGSRVNNLDSALIITDNV